jgi:dTDP-4-dehydrorhamnose reductase
MSRFLVTGASGLLGLHFCLQAGQQHQVVGVVNQNKLQGVPFEMLQADLSQPGVPEQVLEEVRPDVILHCAAMANIDDCESRPEMAQRVNADLPGQLADLAGHRGIKMVYISTDAVFDGQKGNYTEEDQPNPLSVYSLTKLAGEQAVSQVNSQAIIARVNFYGWSLRGQRSLVEFFFNNLSQGKPVNGFTDVYFCPLMVSDLADILVEMVGKDLHGLYHVFSQETFNKYTFGCKIAHQFGFDESLVNPISWRDGGLKAARSPNLIMNVSKLARALGHNLPGQEAGLQRFYQQYVAGLPERIHGFVV